jgi:hypothetical protein
LSKTSIPTDPASGDLVLDIIPRTDTKAHLLALAGGAGEISSPTDTIGFVRHTGVAGKAVEITPYPSSRVVDVSSGSTVDPVSPDAALLLFDLKTNTNTITIYLASGYYVGQQVELDILAGTGAILLSLPAAAPYAARLYNLSYRGTFQWNGITWLLANSIASSIASFANNDGTGSVALGGVAVKSSLAIFNGTAKDSGGIAIGGITNSAAGGAGNIAIGGNTVAGDQLGATVCSGSVAIGYPIGGLGAKALDSYSLNLLSANSVRNGCIGLGGQLSTAEFGEVGRVKEATSIMAGWGFSSNCVYAGDSSAGMLQSQIAGFLSANTSTNTQTLMTIKGNVAAGDNQIYIGGGTAVVLGGIDFIESLRIVVLARVASTGNFARFVREIVATKTDPAFALVSTATPTPDVFGGTLTAVNTLLAITVNATTGILELKVTGPAATAVTWGASITGLQMTA